MTVVSKVILPAAVVAGAALTAGGHSLPHPSTVPAHIDELEVNELEVEEPPVPAYRTDPVTQDWINRFGHISSLRLIALMARAIETKIRHLWDGKSNPPGSLLEKRWNKNRFGRPR